MRIVVLGPERRLCALAGESAIDLHHASVQFLQAKQRSDQPLASDLAGFIAGGQRALELAQAAIDHITHSGQETGAGGEKLRYAPAEMVLRRPQVPGSRLACAGANFASHVAGMMPRQEGGQAPTVEAAYDRIRSGGCLGFWKLPDFEQDPGDDLVYPARTERFDYEGEVAVILGKSGKDVKAGDAASYIWGITLHNDVSIRDNHNTNMLNTFTMNKNFDSCSALGPCIVVGELDPHNIAVETRINGELRQQYNSKDMVFNFYEFIEYLSRDYTLAAGDVISGGTAAGTAQDSTRPNADGVRDPGRFLKVSDEVVISAAGIGELRNRVVAKAR